LGKQNFADSSNTPPEEVEIEGLDAIDSAIWQALDDQRFVSPCQLARRIQIPMTTVRYHWSARQFNVPQWIKSGIKIREASVSRLPHPPNSSDLSPCDFWLFETLKRVLKDREFNSSDEIEEVITEVWDEFTFDEVQSVFHNWMNRFTWLIENGGEYIIE
jgi:hypothetical protein